MELLSPSSKNFLVSKTLIKLSCTLDKTPLGETGCLCYLYYLLDVEGSSFLNHRYFPSTVSYTTLGTPYLTEQPLSDLQHTMPHHWSPSASHPTCLSDAEDFPRGGKYSKHMSQPRFLAYLQPV